jgi:hypothetical protein
MKSPRTNTYCSNGFNHSFCYYPETEHLSEARIKTPQGSHRLCVFVVNSVNNVYGSCTGGWVRSQSVGSLGTTRLKSAEGYAYDGAALSWSSALVYWP